MLSVLKNTKTPVKFWFLKNYLSPTFKVGFPPPGCLKTSSRVIIEAEMFSSSVRQ